MELNQKSIFCLTLLDDRDEANAKGPISDTCFDALVKWGKKGIPVTLAIANPRALSVEQAQAILSMGHEMALIGTGAWVEGSRGNFAKGLVERLGPNNRSPFSPSSLVVPHTEISAHHDLLVKYGFRALVDTYAKGTPLHKSSPFFGLMRVPITLNCQSGEDKILASLLARARRDLLKTAKQGGQVHLAIPLKAIQAKGKGEAALSNLMGAVMQHSHQNAVMVRTLAEQAAAIAIGQKSTPARSILRAA